MSQTLIPCIYTHFAFTTVVWTAWFYSTPWYIDSWLPTGLSRVPLSPNYLYRGGSRLDVMRVRPSFVRRKHLTKIQGQHSAISVVSNAAWARRIRSLHSYHGIFQPLPDTVRKGNLEKRRKKGREKEREELKFEHRAPHSFCQAVVSLYKFFS